VRGAKPATDKAYGTARLMDFDGGFLEFLLAILGFLA
jgi:hypothetical protein